MVNRIESAMGAMPPPARPGAPPARGGETAVEKAQRAAHRHSARVRMAKIWVPVAVLLISGLVLLRTFAYSYLPGVNMPSVLFSKNGLTMVEPRLAGRSHDRAYDIGALRATQDFANPKVVQLEQLSGRIELRDNGWLKITAQTGTYDGNGDRLRIAGDIRASTSTGYQLRAEDADISLQKGDLATDRPVHLDGPAGQLDAGGARVTDGGATLLFVNGIHLTLQPQAASRPAAPEPQEIKP